MTVREQQRTLGLLAELNRLVREAEKLPYSAMAERLELSIRRAEICAELKALQTKHMRQPLTLVPR